MSNKLKTIPLCQLKPSKANVRKTEPHAEVEQLAASIEANGLLENLIVKRAGGEDDTYEVVAGGRRLAALKLLAKRRKLERDHRVSCLLIHEEDAVEVSLAENFARMPLHPADQCDAFAALAREGKPADEIAARFGISDRFVLQRLKLAEVSPRLIAEFRAGAMTLEQLTAFTLSGDHAAQERVWFERAYDDVSAQEIRRRLTSSHVEASDPRARFVGAKAYEVAGGVIVRDLFDAEDGGYFSDSVLLDRLVSEKLAGAAAPVLAEGWQWVEVHADLSRLELHRYGRARKVEFDLCDKDEKRLSKLAARYDQLVADLGEGEENAELDRVGEEIARLQDKKEGWAPEDKGRAGAIVTLGPDGEPEAIRGLIRPGLNSPSQKTEQKSQPRANGYSEAVLLDLSAHRTAALREIVASQPDTALTALLHTMLGALFYSREIRSCFGIFAETHDLERLAPSVAESSAGRAFAARHKSWAERLPEPENCWSWLSQLAKADRHDLLAHCVAMTVNALGGRIGSDPDAVDALARETALEMRDWWRPTQAHFLDRLTKTEILAAVSEGVSREASSRLAGFKKDRMAKQAEELLVESSWLPAPLRSPSAESLESASAA